MMARQRAVYVIEFKACNGRKWFEADCEVTLSFAKAKFNYLVKSNPDDNWRVVKYYPRDDTGPMLTQDAMEKAKTKSR